MSTPEALQIVKPDSIKMQVVVGKAQVPWKEVIRAMVEATLVDSKD